MGTTRFACFQHLGNVLPGVSKTLFHMLRAYAAVVHLLSAVLIHRADLHWPPRLVDDIQHEITSCKRLARDNSTPSRPHRQVHVLPTDTLCFSRNAKSIHTS